MEIRRYAQCVLLALSIAGHAQAQSPSDSCPPAGTAVEGEAKREKTAVRFSGVAGNYCTGKEQRGDRRNKTRRYFGGIFHERDMPLKDAPREAPEALAKLWPLEVGKEVIFSAAEYRDTYKFTVRITGREHVTTKAGSFDAFVIRQSKIGTIQHDSAPYLRVRNETLWYAPEVGVVVKEDDVLSDGKVRTERHWQAVAITPGIRER